MKQRPDGHLAKLYADQRSSEEAATADYITELHEYLWRFVRAELPFASGNLNKYIDVALESVESKLQTNKGA